MRIIGLANGKGGVGKSAAAVNLACQAVAAGESAAIVDMDVEQGTSAKWGARRDGELLPRVEKASVITLGPLLEKLKADKIKWVFLDLPGRAAAVSTAGLNASDFVLVPVRPLDVDIEASLTTVQAAVNIGKAYAYLINIAQGSDQKKRAKQVQGFLRAHGHKVVDTIIIQRIAVPEAMADGKGVNEVKSGRDSAEEFSKLFHELKKGRR